jgi:hypothetical protein
MGDLITLQCVLKKSVDPSRPDRLAVGTKQTEHDNGYREISCKPKGSTMVSKDYDEKHIWEYEEKDGRLHLTPSLLCTITGFHTDFYWDVAFVLCPPEGDVMLLFMALHPQFD